MPASNDPNLGLSYGWNTAESGWGTAMNTNLKQIGALLFGDVIDRDLTTPPGTPAEGDRYIVGAGSTGAWAGQDGNIAHYIQAAWAFYAVIEGWVVRVVDEDIYVRHNGSAWVGLTNSEDVLSPAIATGVLTLDMALARSFDVTLTENVTTTTPSNVPATGARSVIDLILRQDATGSRTFAFPAGTIWPGGTPPTITATANAVDRYVLTSVNGGTTWLGIVSQQAFA